MHVEILLHAIYLVLLDLIKNKKNEYTSNVLNELISGLEYRPTLTD